MSTASFDKGAVAEARADMLLLRFVNSATGYANFANTA
jgi:hypothetical protein